MGTPIIYPIIILSYLAIKGSVSLLKYFGILYFVKRAWLPNFLTKYLDISIKSG